MSRRKGLAAWLRAAAVTSALAGVGAEPQSRPAADATFERIEIDVDPVPLNSQNPSDLTIGNFVFAGGVKLSSRQTDQLHGLSDLLVTDTGWLTAIGDEGIVFDAQLRFDAAERLVGLTEARFTLLTGEDGLPFADKQEADAEGLVRLPNGDLVVSFEQRHRIWLYPAGGGPPRPVAAPVPDVPFPANGGMEALAGDPDAGPDAFIVGAESSGQTWTCRVSAPSCTRDFTVEKHQEFGLVALTRLPGMQTAYLLRAFDPERGNRIALQIFRSNTLVDQMDLARPMTIDNFEGLAAVPRSDGRTRFYLMSDDNGSPTQHTLLFAFDWTPRLR